MKKKRRKERILKIEDEEEKKQDKYNEEKKESNVSFEEIQENEFLFLEKNSKTKFLFQSYTCI